MQAKMIVTDLDRTLLKADQTISNYTASIFKRCQANGMKIAFATARPERATRHFHDKITPDYVIADNGATIHQKQMVIRRLLIPTTIKDELLSAFLSNEAVSLIVVKLDTAYLQIMTALHGGPAGI